MQLADRTTSLSAGVLPTVDTAVPVIAEEVGGTDVPNRRFTSVDPCNGDEVHGGKGLSWRLQSSILTANLHDLLWKI